MAVVSVEFVKNYNKQNPSNPIKIKRVVGKIPGYEGVEFALVESLSDELVDYIKPGQEIKIPGHKTKVKTNPNNVQEGDSSDKVTFLDEIISHGSKQLPHENTTLKSTLLTGLPTYERLTLDSHINTDKAPVNLRFYDAAQRYFRAT